MRLTDCGMKSWLQLLRVPNLFTVPGDPVAGWLLASGAGLTFRPAFFLVIAASLSLYSFGLVLNDLMDLRVDRVERPARPLPAREICLFAAWTVAILLVALGIVLCARASRATLYCGIALTAAIISYNCGIKRIAVAGAVNMGVCRGLNMLLGAAFAGAFPIPVIAAVCFVTVYITGITSLARAETANPAIPPLVGKLIRGLIPIQAIFCVISGTGQIAWISAAFLVVVLWPLSQIVGRRFYAS